MASGRYWREVPIGAPSHDQVLEGFVDLLFETPAGYEIVDYKTDPAGLAEQVRQYGGFTVPSRAILGEREKRAR